MDDNQIDWDCVFVSRALGRGGGRALGGKKGSCLRSNHGYLTLFISHAIAPIYPTLLLDHANTFSTNDSFSDGRSLFSSPKGPDSLSEVNKKGGYMTSCSPRDYACSR